MRLAIIFNQFGPYHYSRLNAAGEKMILLGIEVFSQSHEYDWNEQFGCEVISFRKKTLFKKGENFSKIELEKRFKEVILDFGPNVIAVNGWSEYSAFVAVKIGISHRIPLTVMSDSTYIDERRVWWKEWIKRQYIKSFSSAFVAGKPHKQYIEFLEMPENRVLTGFDSVDNDYFEKESRKHQILSKTTSYNLPTNYFLASCRFIEKKNLDFLLKAYANYVREVEEPWNLVLLGDGHLRPYLEKIVAEEKITELVIMPGFIQYNELPKYYAFAKVFIHASNSEQWGLVVNEAMASGLPVLVSDRCGCVHDLVELDINGYIFNPFNLQMLTDFIKKLSALSDFDLQKMGEASRKIVMKFSPKSFAENLLEAANTAVRLHRSSPYISKFIVKILLIITK